MIQSVITKYRLNTITKNIEARDVDEQDTWILKKREKEKNIDVQLGTKHIAKSSK